MKTQTMKEIVASFQSEIATLFSEKIGLGSIRGQILDELKVELRAKKVSDAKNREVSKISKQLTKEIYDTLVSEFPEISGFISVSLQAGSVCLGGFGEDYISVETSYKTINSSLDHKELKFEIEPFKIRRKSGVSSCFSTLEEMYESSMFLELIKKYYTKLELVKINTSK